MLAWFVADLKTGSFVDELPLRTSGLESTIGQTMSVAATLDVADPSCPPGWEQKLDGERALIVAVDDDRPLIGYVVTDAPEIGGPTVPLTLVSMDYIGTRVNVPTLDFDQVDDATVAAALLAPVAAGWGFEVTTTLTGQSGSHSYSTYEDVTVDSAVSDLTGQEGGPEVAYRIRWEDATHRRFIKTIEIGPQVGRDVPSVIFEDVHLAKRRRSRSWRRMAKRTIATGNGIGESRPMSTPVVDDVALAAGVPPWESRVSTSLDDESALDRYAVASAVRNRHGTQVWDLTVAQTADGAPRVGHDYDTGDIVTMQLEPTRYDRASWHGRARVIGWRAQIEGRRLTEVTPVFWNPDDEES